MRKRLIRLLLTESEREGLIRLDRAVGGAHYVDLYVRRGGRDERSQADYLRPLARLVHP